MAIENNDIIGQLLQEVFTERDGLKHLLEMLLGHTMRTEVSEHLKADVYERCSRHRGRPAVTVINPAALPPASAD